MGEDILSSADSKTSFTHTNQCSRMSQIKKGKQRPFPETETKKFEDSPRDIYLIYCRITTLFMVISSRRGTERCTTK